MWLIGTNLPRSQSKQLMISQDQVEEAQDYAHEAKGTETGTTTVGLTEANS